MTEVKQNLPQAIFLMGPTASGKTALAINLRKTLPVELISVDSALIYQGMDIGTAKPTAQELARLRIGYLIFSIRHRLIPPQISGVMRWQKWRKLPRVDVSPC